MAQRITLDLLTQKCAPIMETTLFAELFPNGTEVTEELCIRCAGQFDFSWALRNLLPEEAKAECDRINDKAWAECQRIKNEAWAKRKCLHDLSLTCDKALAEYLHTRDEALAAYQRVCATEFARLWNKYMSD